MHTGHTRWLPSESVHFDYCGLVDRQPSPRTEPELTFHGRTSSFSSHFAQILGAPELYHFCYLFVSMTFINPLIF